MDSTRSCESEMEKLCILVEGDCPELHAVVRLLCGQGYNVMHAPTSELALEFYREHRSAINRIFFGDATGSAHEVLRQIVNDPGRKVDVLSTNPDAECRRMQAKWGCRVIERPDSQHIKDSICAGMPV